MLEFSLSVCSSDLEVESPGYPVVVLLLGTHQLQGRNESHEMEGERAGVQLESCHIKHEVFGFHESFLVDAKVSSEEEPLGKSLVILSKAFVTIPIVVIFNICINVFTLGLNFFDFIERQRTKVSNICVQSLKFGQVNF